VASRPPTGRQAETLVFTASPVTVSLSRIITGVTCQLQSPAEECLYQFFRSFLRCAGVNGDPVLGEEINGARAHATGKDNVSPLLGEPWRQHTGLMRRRRDPVGSTYRSCGFVYVDQRELFTMAKMGAQHAPGSGDSNNHVFPFVCHNVMKRIV